MRMIRFEEVDKKQGWGRDHVTDYMTMILHRLHKHNIINNHLLYKL